MRRLGILLLLLAAVLFLGIVVFPKKNTSLKSGVISTPTVLITPTSSQTTFCTSKDLQSNITTEGAAGNIYGTLTIKNISSHNCAIEGDKFVSALFTASNLTLSSQGEKGPAMLELSPDQIVYSQIHYPNGPQCMSGITQTRVTYTYAISSNSSVDFVSSGNLPTDTITICKSPNEKTQLDVWSISLKPLH